jgi:hypothetical protein
MAAIAPVEGNSDREIGQLRRKREPDLSRYVFNNFYNLDKK